MGRSAASQGATTLRRAGAPKSCLRLHTRFLFPCSLDMDSNLHQPIDGPIHPGLPTVPLVHSVSDSLRESCPFLPPSTPPDHAARPPPLCPASNASQFACSVLWLQPTVTLYSYVDSVFCATVYSDMHDAHVLLEAVRLHKLQPVTRRLNEVEVCGASPQSCATAMPDTHRPLVILQRMSFIRSGSVFVWEESDDDTGLRRWTDGLLWSASRMREVSPSSVHSSLSGKRA